MKYIYIFLLMMATQIVAGQSILQFQNLTPIWSHSSEISENNDGLYESIKPVIIHGDLYLTTATALNYFNGFLLEKMDLSTGTVIWENKYFPIGFHDREYPQRPFILNDQLVLPSFRESEPTGEILWNKSRLAYRIYDDSTGEIRESFMDDSLGVEMIIPPKSLFGTKNELIHNKNKIQYLFGNYSPVSYLFDYDANVILDTTLVTQSPVFKSKSGNYIVFQGKIIKYVVLQDIFTSQKTVRIDILNLDFEFEKTIDISKYILHASKSELVYADNDVFIIESQTKETIDGNSEITHRKYYMFDYDRNLLDRVGLDWFGDKMGNEYYYNIKIGRNTAVDRILALITNDDKNGFHNLEIKESDGTGTLNTLAEFKGKNKIDKFNVFHFDFTKNGDMLISLEYIIEHNPGNISESDFRVNTILVSKDDF